MVSQRASTCWSLVFNSGKTSAAHSLPAAAATFQDTLLACIALLCSSKAIAVALVVSDKRLGSTVAKALGLEDFTTNRLAFLFNSAKDLSTVYCGTFVRTSSEA